MKCVEPALPTTLIDLKAPYVITSSLSLRSLSIIAIDEKDLPAKRKSQVALLPLLVHKDRKHR
jgi:hypothetical protein